MGPHRDTGKDSNLYDKMQKIFIQVAANISTSTNLYTYYTIHIRWGDRAIAMANPPGVFPAVLLGFLPGGILLRGSVLLPGVLYGVLPGSLLVINVVVCQLAWYWCIYAPIDMGSF